MQKLEFEDLLGRIPRFEIRDKTSTEMSIIVLERALIQLEEIYAERQTGSAQMVTEELHQYETEMPPLESNQLSVPLAQTHAHNHSFVTATSLLPMSDVDASTKRSDPILCYVRPKKAQTPVNKPTRPQLIASKAKHGELRKREKLEIEQNNGSPPQESKQDDDKADALMQHVYKRQKKKTRNKGEAVANAQHSNTVSSNEHMSEQLGVSDHGDATTSLTLPHMQLAPLIKQTKSHDVKYQRLCSQCLQAGHIFTNCPRNK